MSLLSPSLEAFLIVAEKSSVTAAAQRLRLGQTAVTQRIRSLEKELGVTLFTRSRQGMRLTREGQSLLKYCLRSQELEGQVLSDLKNTKRSHEIELRMAGPTSFLSGRAVPRLASVLKEWPHVNLQFQIDDSENRLQLIKQGRADLVVLPPHQVPLELDSKVLKADEYYLLGTPAWQGRALKEILLQERLFAFHEEDQTSLNYLKAFDLLPYLKRPRLFVNENLALATLLKEGIGFGLLSKEVAEPWLARGELIKLNQGRSLKDPLALAWYPRLEMPDYFRAIIDAMK